MEKEIINEFFRDIREFKKKVLEQTNNTFKISFIKYIKDENTGKNIDTKRFTLKKSFIGKNLDKVIFNNKIYFKNRGKHENIYISLDDTNKKTNLLWLDDIKLENFTEKQLEYITLIETSPNNYQGYIIMDKEVDKNTLKQIKKYFHKKYNTDIGSIDFTHLMRLPYFYSYKHEIPHYVVVKQYQKEILPITTIIKQLKTDNEIKQNNIQNNDKIHINTDKLEFFYDLYLKEKKKEKLQIDYNVIDFRFLHFLHYFTDTNIESVSLQNIFYNIEERKKGHIDDYINRTKNKVYNIYENNENYENYDYNLLQTLYKKHIKTI